MVKLELSFKKEYGLEYPGVLVSETINGVSANIGFFQCPSVEKANFLIKKADVLTENAEETTITPAFIKFRNLPQEWEGFVSKGVALLSGLNDNDWRNDFYRNHSEPIQYRGRDDHF